MIKILIIFLFPFLVFSQNEITQFYKPQEKESLYSEELYENRYFYVNYPLTFDFTSIKEFPMIVVMDWEDRVSNNTIVQNIDFYSFNSLLPPSIIVSVCTAQYKGDRMKLFSENDRNEAFQNFINTELKNYFTQKGIHIPSITYIGQSRGAELGLELMLKNDSSIDNFLLSSGFYSFALNKPKLLKELSDTSKKGYFNWVSTDDLSNEAISENVNNNNLHFQMEKNGNHQSTVVQNISNIINFYSDYSALNYDFQINNKIDLREYIAQYDALNKKNKSGLNYDMITVSNICWELNYTVQNSVKSLDCYNFFFKEIGVYNPEWVSDYLNLLQIYGLGEQADGVKQSMVLLIEAGAFDRFLTEEQQREYKERFSTQ